MDVTDFDITQPNNRGVVGNKFLTLIRGSGPFQLLGQIMHWQSNTMRLSLQTLQSFLCSVCILLPPILVMDMHFRACMSMSYAAIIFEY